MGRKASAHRKARIALMSDAGPGSLLAVAREHFEALRARSFAESTVRNREVGLWRFAAWALDHGVQDMVEVTRNVLESYQKHLFYYRSDDGNPLSSRVQHNHLAHVRAFFKWATKHNLVLHNPASELEMPRIPKTLPRMVLTADEAERVLLVPNVNDPLGIRDRAILETLYSTGIRRSELGNLSVYDVDRTRGTVFIKQGKGKRDRIVPIGERALRWIEKYLEDVRPSLAGSPDEGTLFLGNHGEQLWTDHLSTRVSRYVEQANINKKGGCHIFRHTAATLMLENGADIRFIQALLGHSDLSTTEIYTRVSIHKLKEIHTATHPSAKLKRADTNSQANEVEALMEALEEDAAADPE